MAHNMARRILMRLGYDLRRADTAGWSPQNLRVRAGITPRTVIDVGVGPGTPGLYEAFPDAHLVLIEPLREFEPGLRRLLRNRKGDYLLTAVGAVDGSAVINADPKLPAQSSIKTRSPLVASTNITEVRKIPITTLDQLYEQFRWTGPLALKIDTEGYEHLVVEGASRLLQDTQFVIAEVSVARRFEDSYSFADFITLMQRQGFVTHDVLDAPRTPNGELGYLDMLFRRVE